MRSDHQFPHYRRRLLSESELLDFDFESELPRDEDDEEEPLDRELESLPLLLR
ncbi:MAG: hypothetical protein R3F19_10085 [Verrucomicrobiales bacterium]